jgi:hypothetical protein
MKTSNIRTLVAHTGPAEKSMQRIVLLRRHTSALLPRQMRIVERVNVCAGCARWHRDGASWEIICWVDYYWEFVEEAFQGRRYCQEGSLWVFGGRWVGGRRLFRHVDFDGGLRKCGGRVRDGRKSSRLELPRLRGI